MTSLSRRAFLQQSLLAGAAAMRTSRADAQLAARVEPHAAAPCPPTAWKKHGIILEPTEPWEGSHIQNFTQPAEPLDKDRWRLWYSAVDEKKAYAIACAEGTPGGPMKKYRARCAPGEPPDAPLAVGNLPEKWNPVQVIHVRLKSGKHRIYFWVHGPGVLRYLAADSDDGHRYRVVDPLRPVLYHPADRAARGVPSPDGVMLAKERSSDRPADEPLAASHLISNDATNVYQLPDGSFEMYSVALVSVPKDDPAYVAEDNAPGLLRVIDRYGSADGLHFENRVRVIQRDARDPVDQQFYYLAVTYTPKGRVGMLGHYRVRAQTMDLEWCFSTDGLKWHRPDRTPWLARGKPGEPDSYGIYSGNSIVRRDGRWHLFYTGVNSSHNGRDSHGTPRTVIMHATTDSIWA